MLKKGSLLTDLQTKSRKFNVKTLEIMAFTNYPEDVKKETFLISSFLKHRFHFFILIMLFFSSFMGSLAVATSPTNFPMIRTIGIIPFQWQGIPKKSYEWHQVTSKMDKTFKDVVRSAKRFRVINDQIMDELWASSDGRKALVNQYEVQGFINLTISEQNGLIQFIARLLSPSMENYFIETKRLTESDVLNKSPREIKEFLSDLTFKLINRFPVDFHVTSIQGKFLTISAGKNQKIFEKNIYKINRVHSIKTHPATGAFTEFSLNKVGKIEIIEARKYTSIAKIISQTTEASIKIGDGSKSFKMVSRARFPANSQATLTNVSTIAPTKIITIRKKKPEKKKQEKDSPWFDSKPIVKKIEEPKKKENVIEKPITQNIISKELPEPPAIITKETAQKPLAAHVGIFQFKASGSSGATSKIPDILINKLGLSVTKPNFYLDYHLKYGGNFMFGDTEKGSYNGFNIFSEAYYASTLENPVISFTKIKLGIFSKYDSLGVSKETFGGYDSGNVGFMISTETPQTKFNDFLNAKHSLGLSLSPIAFGVIGSQGSKKTIKKYISSQLNYTTLFEVSKNGFTFGPNIDLYFQQYYFKSSKIDVTSLDISLTFTFEI